MLRRKKQLLGAVGLALVAMMTAVAWAMPAPDAAAVGETQSGSVGLTVRVQGEGRQPKVSIDSLDMDDIVVTKSFKVRISYALARDLNGLHVYLKDNGAVAEVGAVTGRVAQPGEIELPLDGCNVTYSEDTQSCDIQYTLDADLSPEQRVWSYTTRAEVFSPEGLTTQDIVNFFYQSAHIVFNGEFAANGNPYVDVLLNPDVDKIQIQVFDKDGNKVFVNGSDDVPLEFTREQLEAMGLTADGKVRVELPFDKFKIKDGAYTAGLVAYNADGEIIALSETKAKINYKSQGGSTDPGKPDEPDNPDKPEVPDTGNNLFRNLNISNVDYIITGLVAFGMVTAFAVILIIRRNKR